MSEEDVQLDADVIVVGGGNAGFSAALAAAERGRSVVLLERASEADSGGNSFYTAGATRVVHRGFDELKDIVDDDDRHGDTEVPPYTREEFFSDMARVTDGANDPALTEVLAEEGLNTVRWLNGHGLRYRLMYERQAYERPGGGYLFWGGLHIGNTGGGEGLMADHKAAAERLGIEVRYDHHCVDLLQEDGRIVGVFIEGREPLRAESVILAAGGFEADADMRREYLGAGWENAKVRGTPFNDGRMIRAALGAGAVRAGDWSTCHSVAWDAWAENNESNRELTNRLTRQSYPIGVVVNRHGDRFLDEGADFRNYTYAKYGREILAQPGSIAYQLFDANLRPMLRTEEYDMPGVGVATADTIEELADAAGIERDALARTIVEFNASIDRDVVFDPTIKDGRRASVHPPKSNWAAPIERAPFYAYPVTCGITFTFGGIKTTTWGEVVDAEEQPIPGLYAAGEMLGGLFKGNYPGGSGLTAGMVFGRRAGSRA
jgi:tricarballylate dehydrogenase